MPSTVSIIVPCYNEQNRIRFLLDAIYLQTYPRDKLEVVIADGHSTDKTRDVIADFQSSHPDLIIKIMDNDSRTIPAALNTALRAAGNDLIVRLDAHSAPQPDYVARCVASLEAGLADNVGGVWEIRAGADTNMARSIAIAAAHPLGVGDALYRHAKASAYVDTVPFGSFYRALIERIGYFDETLLANEDYEFNTRIRKSGGKIWLDPAIRSVYFARATLKDLAIQYSRYGFWKTQMLKRYPETIRWRQALPPLFVSSLLSGVLLVWHPIFRFVFILEMLLYFSVLFFTSARIAVREKNLSYLWGVPAAIATMHLAWGGSFILGLVKRAV